MKIIEPLSTIGIGSVPFIEGEDGSKIFQVWDIPFWPQYPSRSLKENFVFQFLSHFPGLEVTDDNASFDERCYLKETPFYRQDLQKAFEEKRFLAYEPSQDWALGYSQLKTLLEANRFPERKTVKLQVTGPDTVWNSFFSKSVSKARAGELFDDLLMALIVSGLAQIERIHSFRRTPVIFIDEPARSQNTRPLKNMVQYFRKVDALVGIHLCSNSDWNGLEEIDFDLIHFDLKLWRGTSAENIFLDRFLKQGKWIVLGIIPTPPDKDFQTQDFSSSLLDPMKGLQGLGWSLDEILQHCLLAPACGAGTLTPEEDRKVTEGLLHTVERLKNSYFHC